MKRCGQIILVLRETVSSYTLSTMLESERHADLRDGLVTLASQVKSLGDCGIHIRVDSAPGLVALKNDSILQDYGVSLVYGAVKNVNKNPVAEKAIEELASECLHAQPEGGPLTKVTLALATAQLNERIRRGGLSAREIWTQRDQVTGAQLPVEDNDLISQQHSARLGNHTSSAKSKLQGRAPGTSFNIGIGNLVYLQQERNTTKPRDKYIITNIHEDGMRCSVRKYTKDQFRTRLYEVLLCDCYPVMPTVLPTRKLQYTSESDEEIPILPMRKPLHQQPEIPVAINVPLDPPDEKIDLDPPEEELEQPDPPIPPGHNLAGDQPDNDLTVDQHADYDPPDDQHYDQDPLGDSQLGANDHAGANGPLCRSSRRHLPNQWYNKDTWVLNNPIGSDED